MAEPLRIIAVSDLHLDWVTMGVPRFEEIRRSLGVAVRHAIDGGVDLFLCLGDVCNPDSGSIVLRCAQEVVAVADKLARFGVRSAWVCGNHDVAGDCATTSLDPLLGLAERGVVVFKDAPGAVDLGKGWALVGLPYPSRPEGWVGGPKVGELLEGVDPKPKVIVAGHLSIEGVQPGEESDELSRGRDVFWPAAEVAKLKPEFTCAGHYHRRHVTKEGIQVVGSLARLTFAAEEHEPGYLYVELHRGA